jgi:hypothetical protein
VMGGDDHAPAGTEDAVELAQGRVPVGQIVHDQRGDDDVERLAGEGQGSRRSAW